MSPLWLDILRSVETAQQLNQRLTNVMRMPTLLWGIEVRTLNKRKGKKKKIEAVEMWIYRRTGRISRKRKQKKIITK